MMYVPCCELMTKKPTLAVRASLKRELCVCIASTVFGHYSADSGGADTFPCVRHLPVAGLQQMNSTLATRCCSCSCLPVCIVCWTQDPSALFPPVFENSSAANSTLSCPESRCARPFSAEHHRLKPTAAAGICCLATYCQPHFLLPCNVQAMDPLFLA